MKTLILVFLGGAVSYILALLWWRLWMYHGVIAPPDFLEPFFKSDGDGVYTRVEIEMFLVIFLPVIFGIIFMKIK